MNRKNYSVAVRVESNGQELITKTFDEFPIVFGRSGDCHLSFPQNNRLSKVHGMITYNQGRVRIEDADSTNGTYVRSQKTNGPVVLERGEKFAAGGFDFLVTVTEIAAFDSEATQVASPNARPVVNKIAVIEPTVEVNFSEAVNRPQEIAAQVFDALGDYTVISNRLMKVSRDLRLEDETDLRRVKPFDLTLQGVVTWGPDIFDVRQFKDKDIITVGGDPVDSVYVPFINKKIKLGLVHQNKGYLIIPKTIRWRLDREGYSFTPVESMDKKIAKDMGKNIKVPLVLNDLCTLDLGEEVTLHFRYVKVPRPLIGRSWLENREEIKKAISLSLAIHCIVAFIAMFLAPKTKAPKIENVPQRFAKLLVEPPKMILVPPPEIIPEPIVEKKPEPAPIPVVEKKPEPPKPIAKKKPTALPKKVVKVEKAVPVVPQKVTPTPVQKVATPAKEHTTPQPVAKALPQPSVEDSFANAFATAAPAANASKVASTNIQINKDPDRAGTAGGGVGKGLAGTLKSKVGEMNQGSGGGSGGGLGTSVGAGVGQVGYAKAGGASQAGKRGIASVVVGTPKLKESDIPQGLSQNEVMNEVNKHLAEVRRCYERALFQDTNISGRVEYEWNINPKGVVTSAQVTRSGVSNGDFLNNCVIGVIKKMKFPNSKNGQPTVTNIGFPFGKE